VILEGIIKFFKTVLIVSILVFLFTSCNQLERVTKKLSGGLSEIISEAVDGIVQATIKVIFLGVLSTQEDGTQLIAFAGETASGKQFKGVALGAIKGLASAEVGIKGKAFTVQAESILLANGVTTEGKIPLVMIATELDTLIKQPSEGQTLSDKGRLDMIAQTVNKGEISPTVFRYIGETEKNLSLLGIGVSQLNLPASVQAELLEWQSAADLHIEGTVLKTEIGAILRANAEIRASIQGETQTLKAVTYSVLIQRNN
jgi:hypothetical protein